MDWSLAYCVPVCVVAYGKSCDRLTWPTCDPGLGDGDDGGGDDEPQQRWTAPFRWHWRKDDGRFEPYADAINNVLEQHHDLWKHSGGPARFRTQPLTRYVDDKPQEYDIDFVKTVQANASTGYQRALQRKQVRACCSSGTPTEQDT